ncbi:MAG: single-stranded DNA-binding protein [Clostridia bacterium]|nr:single-stranded DNA-binding protein [Clostridia bacterium]
MNKVFLIGNLTRDPELSQLPSGVSVCKFGLAVNRNFTNSSGEREVDFFNITAWRGLGENCAKYLSKGRKVSVVGNIQVRNYEDKDGNKRTAVDIVAEDIEFLSRNDDGDASRGGAGGGNNGGGRAPRKQVSELTPVDNEDLPF